MVATRLAKGVADGGHEAGQRHGILVAVADAGRPDHHGHAGDGLRHLVPSLLLQRRKGDNGELEVEGSVKLVADADAIVVYLLKFQLISLAVHGLRRDDDALRPLVMADDEGGVGAQGNLPFKSILVLGQYLLFRGIVFLLLPPLLHGRVGVLAVFLRLLTNALFFLRLLFPLILLFLLLLSALAVAHAHGSLVEACIGLLEEGHKVVEFDQIKVAVDLQLPVVGNGVAEVGAVLELRPPRPVVGRVIGGIGSKPGEDRE